MGFSCCLDPFSGPPIWCARPEVLARRLWEFGLGVVTMPVPNALPPAAPSTASGANALAALLALVGPDLAACNRAIVERMDSPVALIPQLAAHIVAAGGKRLRPLLTLASAQMCGYRGTRHVALAACVEFIHTATLLHDDVVDESALRRGQASDPALAQKIVPDRIHPGPAGHLLMAAALLTAWHAPAPATRGMRLRRPPTGAARQQRHKVTG